MALTLNDANRFPHNLLVIYLHSQWLKKINHNLACLSGFFFVFVFLSPLNPCLQSISLDLVHTWVTSLSLFCEGIA